MDAARADTDAATPGPRSVHIPGCGSQPTLYAPLLPGPVRIEVGGVTGLLALEDDPARLGVLHGALAGLAYPSIPGTVDEFVANCGPDASLTGETRTAEALRERMRWIEAASRLAMDPADKATVLRELDGARERADVASAGVDAVARSHGEWRHAFVSASGPARSLSRLLRALACVALGYAMAGGALTFALWCGAAFLAVGISSRLAFRRVFDRQAAYGIRAPLYAERTRGTALRVADMQARGLLAG